MHVSGTGLIITAVALLLCLRRRRAETYQGRIDRETLRDIEQWRAGR
jgi:hypothetical protein